MTKHPTLIAPEGGLDLAALRQYTTRPEPFARGEPLFWDDPHISQQMLKAHLDPTIEAASRPPDIIDTIVSWLIQQIGLKPGDAVLDLGCGPGLYCERFARAGLKVTGVDYSRNSINYARASAERQALDIEYHYQNYLDINYDHCFRAVFLIYGDFCTFAPPDRDLLLGKVKQALVPEGHFAFDVTTRVCRKRVSVPVDWSYHDSGFWKPGPHLVLRRDFDYPEIDLNLAQYTVIEQSGKVSNYRIWHLDYSVETLTPVLQQQGFAITGIWSDLSGTPLPGDGEWLGAIARAL